MYRLLYTKSLVHQYYKIFPQRYDYGYECYSNLSCGNIINNHLGGNLQNGFYKFNSQFSSPNAGVKEPKKLTRKSKYSKYVELLQVTKSTTTQTRTKVKKLKAKMLADFIKKSIKKRVHKTNQPTLKQPLQFKKINLEMLECPALQHGRYDKVPFVFFGKEHLQIPKTDEDFQIIKTSFERYKQVLETFEGETPLEADDKLEVENENNLKLFAEEGESEKTINEDLEKQNSLLKLLESKELENLAKRKSVIINLVSYLNVCVNNGIINRGLSTLLIYRQRYKTIYPNSNFLGIKLYNIAMHGYAKEANFEKINDIIEILKTDHISFDHQTFAAIFECIGRIQNSSIQTELMTKFIKEANEKGYTFNQIMDQSFFQSDEREIVLKAIRLIEPEFVPHYSLPELGYSNVLVNSLNESVNKITQEIDNTQNFNNQQSFSVNQLQLFAKEQFELELKGSVTIQSVEKCQEYENTEECRKKVENLQLLWRKQLSSAILREINIFKTVSRFKTHGYLSYYPYLKCLDTEQYVDILLQEIRNLAEGSETYSPTVKQIYVGLGRKVQKMYQIQQKKNNGTFDKMNEIYLEYCKNLERSYTSVNSRQIWQNVVHKSRMTGPSMDFNDTMWPSNVTIGIGSFLFKILMREIKIDLNMNNKKKNLNLSPAFYSLYRNHGRVVKEEIKPHPVLARLFRSSKQQTLTFETGTVPMLCPPQPWTTPVNGGYLLTKSELIRLPHQAIQQLERINVANPQDLYPALDSLNQLSSIPWKVNKEVLDVILEVFNSGGNSELDVPEPPSSLPALPSQDITNQNLTSSQRNKLFREKLMQRRRQAEMYSLWCDALYRLSLANHYRDRIFWLPHNMDFRGRVYPIPPHLNHLGSDLARSLLVFHKALPLGEDGFMWLKLHCINLTGKLKRQPIKERIIYAEENMSKILDSADHPLTGNKWWAESDEPWQTLACCMEIAKVYRSSDPTKYLSSFPIHQDGSCNGLQHYAALGRDLAGAMSVNLVPSSKPQDVYNSVVNLVEKTRKDDAENGLIVAEKLKGYIKRKVIKQTVMTTVYGVTRYGARLQIAKQLKAIEQFPKEWVWPASTYLTAKTFDSIRQMFTSAREIQDWFTDCARLISAVCEQNVEWLTPLNFPVVQPYNRQDTKCSTKPSPRIYENVTMDMYNKPNIVKQKNAFPPNFVHSLDSTHMMLTSLYCERQGLTFVSVHDCFWTHACTVPDMNKICREQFVALHSQPILENLSDFLIQKYIFSEDSQLHHAATDESNRRKLNKVLKQLPKKGSFNLLDVLNSVYFFS